MLRHNEAMPVLKPAEIDKIASRIATFTSGVHFIPTRCPDAQDYT